MEVYRPMFSIKNKLDSALKYSLDRKLYKNYRVLIHCKNIFPTVEKKLKGYKCEIIHSIPSINCICAKVSAHVIDRLTELPQVDFILLDSFALLCGSSVLISNGVNHFKQLSINGTGVGIGIIDSGVYPHTDLLKPNNKIKSFSDLINNLNYPYDDNGHGTFMCGAICGSGFISKGIYRGVANGSSIHVIKAFNKLGRGSVASILYGLDKLINESAENNIKVICLPFELLDNNAHILSLFSELFDKAVSNNISIVVPSGSNCNDEDCMRGISILPNCITVSGLDTSSSTNPYFYSSGGLGSKLLKPDFAAACVDICSLNSDTTYISEKNGIKLYPHALERPYTCYTGTSCSAAYIAGVCALLYESKPNLLFKDVSALLKVACKNIEIAKHQQGTGIVDISKIFNDLK